MTLDLNQGRVEQGNSVFESLCCLVRVELSLMIRRFEVSIEV